MTSYRNMFRAKIHRARVTAANLEYEGSITIDPVLMEAAGILPFERVQVLNLSNAARAETYAIQGLPNSGDAVLNGALARTAYPVDPVIILAYAWVDEKRRNGCVP
jgi:aspartate 1-decarboxylase